MIPKKIHYCWFGGNPLSELAQKCITSWQKYLPDYEIIRWDESNYDVNKISYTQEAYAAKKYAFVSDYARFDILYHHGGLYFDTDVEVIKDMSSIIKEGAFMGCEVDSRNNLGINSGLGLGAMQGMPIFNKILDAYQDRHFIKDDGSCDYTTVVDIISEIFKEYGFAPQLQKIQKIADTIIYPPEYFCPKNHFTQKLTITDNTYSIHHYDASWYSPSQKIAFKLHRVIGDKFYYMLRNFVKKIKS